MEQVESYTVEEVLALFRSIKLQQYCEVIEAEEIDGFMLVDLVKNDNLKDLDMTGVHQARLRKALTNLPASGAAAPAVAAEPRAPQEAASPRAPQEAASPGVAQEAASPRVPQEVQPAEAQPAAVIDAEARARIEAETRARIEAETRAAIEAETRAKIQAEEREAVEARERAALEARRQEEEARAAREVEERARLEERAREEELARQEEAKRAAEEAKRQAELHKKKKEEVRAKKEAEKRRIEAETRTKVEAEMKEKLEAEKQWRLEAEKAQAEEAARVQARDEALRAAEEKEKRIAEETKRLEAEAQKKWEAQRAQEESLRKERGEEERQRREKPQEQEWVPRAPPRLAATASVKEAELMSAVLADNKDAVCKLLVSRADPQIPDAKGRLPLDEAIAGRSRLIVALLLHTKANTMEYSRSKFGSLSVIGNDVVIEEMLSTPFGEMELGSSFLQLHQNDEWVEARKYLMSAKVRLQEAATTYAYHKSTSAMRLKAIQDEAARNPAQERRRKSQEEDMFDAYW